MVEGRGGGKVKSVNRTRKVNDSPQGRRERPQEGCAASHSLCVRRCGSSVEAKASNGYEIA